jgi:hypothetical protein
VTRIPVSTGMENRQRQKEKKASASGVINENDAKMIIIEIKTMKARLETREEKTRDKLYAICHTITSPFNYSFKQNYYLLGTGAR